MFDMSPEEKKGKWKEIIKSLLKEMNVMDLSKDSEEECDEPMIEEAMEKSAVEDPRDAAEKLVSDGEELSADEGMSKEEIAEMLKDKNGSPKKEGGMISVSMVSATPKSSKKFGKGKRKG